MTQLREFYDRYWEGDEDSPYHDPTPTRRPKLLQALASFGVASGARVLDVGCGDGTYCEYLRDAGYRPAGVDISQRAVRRGMNRVSAVDFKVLNEDLSIPFGDGEFAAVWSSEVIEHVFDVPRYLSEIHRVLAVGGLYILTTPYHGILKNILISLLKFDRHFDPEGPHIRFFDKRGLRRCLEKMGFSVLRWDGIGRVWPLYQAWFVVCRKAEASA